MNKIPIYKYASWVPITWIFLAVGIYQMSHLIIALKLKDPELWEQVLETTGMTEFNLCQNYGNISCRIEADWPWYYNRG